LRMGKVGGMRGGGWGGGGGDGEKHEWERNATEERKDGNDMAGGGERVRERTGLRTRLG
jgi:hypothetical protein